MPLLLRFTLPVIDRASSSNSRASLLIAARTIGIVTQVKCEPPEPKTNTAHPSKPPLAPTRVAAATRPSRSASRIGQVGSEHCWSVGYSRHYLTRSGDSCFHDRRLRIFLNRPHPSSSSLMSIELILLASEPEIFACGTTSRRRLPSDEVARMADRSSRPSFSPSPLPPTAASCLGSRRNPLLALEA